MNENTEIMAVTTDVEVVDTTEHILKMAERRDGLIEKVKSLAIKATHAGDWVDQNGTPYLSGSGVEKVRARFALRLWDVKTQKHQESDEKGDYYYFVVEGKVGFNDSEFIESTGTCSSRDQFFAKRGGQMIPMADVDITNIRKAAYTNFIVNGVTRFLGLRNLTWDQLKDLGILKSGAAKVEYKSGAKASVWSQEQSDKAKRLGVWMLAIADGDRKVAEDALEKATAFTGKNGKNVPGKRNIKNLSGKQIDILFDRNKKFIEEFEAGGGQDDLPFDREAE